MNNDDNQQISQNQNSPEPAEQPAVTESPSNNETTYWESNRKEINQFDQTDTTRQINQFQQTQNQQFNPAQYDQKPFRPMYQVSDYQQPQKNRLRGLIAAITVLVILLAGAGTAYAFRDTLANIYVKTTKSPAEYYAYIEKNYVEESINQLTPYLEQNSINSKIAYDVSSNITINKPAVDSILESSLGVTLADLEAQIGIPLDNIGLNAFFGSDGKFMNESITFSLNQVEIITADMFIDMAAKNILVNFPELSDAYLSIDNSSMTNTDNTSLELINKERTADFLKRYSDIVINHMKQVEQKDNFSLSVGSITSSCTKLTVTITERELYSLMVDILTEAKDDSYILDLLPTLQITKEDYQTNIEQALLELQVSSAKISDSDFQMDVYVDQKGTIIGRELRPSNSVAAFGYTVLTEGAKSEYIVYLKDDTGATVFEVNGEQTKDNATVDGKATVAISGTQDYPTMVSLDITYEDVRTELKDNISYQYGTVTVSSLELMGLQVIVNFDVKDDTQNSKIVFQMGAEPLVTFDNQTKYKKDYVVVTPPADAEIFDISQADAFAATMDLEAYIAKLSEKLGVDLQSIFDSYMYGNTSY